MMWLLSGAFIPHFQTLTITTIEILNNKYSYIAISEFCKRKHVMVKQPHSPWDVVQLKTYFKIKSFSQYSLFSIFFYCLFIVYVEEIKSQLESRCF